MDECSEYVIRKLSNEECKEIKRIPRKPKKRIWLPRLIRLHPVVRKIFGGD